MSRWKRNGDEFYFDGVVVFGFSGVQYGRYDRDGLVELLNEVTVTGTCRHWCEICGIEHF